MNKLVIFGDSLTGGRYGVCYGRFLHHEAILRGIDGQRMGDVISRAIRFCKVNRDTDIIIEGGLNDIVLYDCTDDVFGAWVPGLAELKGLCNDLYVCTITPAGENPASPGNRTRVVLNNEIRNNASVVGYHVIDVAETLDPMVSGSDIIVSPLDVLALDRQRIAEQKDEQGAKAVSMEISASRGFRLTTDGVHLNWTAAQLFAKIVDKALG